MKAIFKTSGVLLFALASLTSCSNSDDYSAPNISCVDPGLVANKTVAEVLAQASNSPVLYTGDDVIEGYVTSSDEKGNFFKTIYLQTLPTDGSTPIGFSVSINLNSTYGLNFYPGRKVFIKLKDLYFARQHNTLTFGGFYQSSPSSAPTIGRISETEWRKFLVPSCDEVSEDMLATEMTLQQALNNANLGRLIDITGVQFADGSLGRTMYDVDNGGGSTNHNISSGTGNASTYLRVSSYADFAHLPVPEGSGKIRGVMTKYNSDFQFMIRQYRDMQLDGERIDAYPAIGGTQIVYNSTFSENFESYATSNNGFTFAKYINDAVIGGRYWDIKSFQNNKYAQMTSHNSNSINKTNLMVPVSFVPGNKLSFKTKDGYYNGAVLKIYYTTDFTPGMNVNNATLVDITSNFTIASGTTGGYADNFTNSGEYTFPANLSGNGFIIFSYEGNGVGNTLTTTIQIDDIIVTN